MVDRCPGCGFEVLAITRPGARAGNPLALEYDETLCTTAGARIEVLTQDVVAALGRASDAELRTRPEPATWSRLEYACHIRDVLLVQRERVLLARRVDDPEPEPMGRDERVDHDGYAQQSPADVGRQLTDAARLFANDLARLRPQDWDRTLTYSWPQRARRSLRWVAVHTLHEVFHHLDDIRRQEA